MSDKSCLDKIVDMDREGSCEDSLLASLTKDVPQLAPGMQVLAAVRVKTCKDSSKEEGDLFIELRNNDLNSYKPRSLRKWHFNYIEFEKKLGTAYRFPKDLNDISPVYFETQRKLARDHLERTVNIFLRYLRKDIEKLIKAYEEEVKSCFLDAEI